jgi:hypothetical protein
VTLPPPSSPSLPLPFFLLYKNEDEWENEKKKENLNMK